MIDLEKEGYSLKSSSGSSKKSVEFEETLFSRIRDNKSIFIAFLVFSVAYCLISYLRYLSFTENTLDLGVNASIAYSVLHGETIVGQVMNGGIAANKLIYIPIGLIYGIFPHEYVLLFIQNIFLSFSGVVIYFMSMHFLHTKKISLLVAMTFYFYFPLAGVYWFDFHYMAFFPTFFLLGTYYYFKGDRKKWTIFLILASITDLMAPIIVFLFLFIGVFKKSYEKGSLTLNKSELAVGGLAIFIFIFPSIYSLYFFPFHYMGINYNSGIYGNVWFKAEFFLRVLWPLLFIPLFGIEFLLLLIPYGLMLFSNSYWPYESQIFFQYPSLYITTIFISFIVGLSRIKKRMKMKAHLNRILGVILLINVLLFMFFSPIGSAIPLQNENHVQEEFITGSNQSLYAFYSKTVPTEADLKLHSYINTIPKGSSVLVSGNMPEFLQGYKAVCLNSNFNQTEPNYIVTDPYSYFFNQSISVGIPQNNSPIVKINYLLNNLNYHVKDYYKGDAIYTLDAVSKPNIQGYINYTSLLPRIENNNSLCFSAPLIAPGSYNLIFNGSLQNNTLSVSFNSSYITLKEPLSNGFILKSTGFIQNLKIILKVNSLTGLKGYMEIEQTGAFSR